MDWLSSFTALLAAAALFFAWRTVVEARRARADEHDARRRELLVRIGRMLAEVAIEISRGGHSRARTLQALLEVEEAALGEGMRMPRVLEVARTRVTAETAPALEEEARDALEDIRDALRELGRLPKT